jgi:hypothetical protein
MSTASAASECSVCAFFFRAVTRNSSKARAACLAASGKRAGIETRLPFGPSEGRRAECAAEGEDAVFVEKKRDTTLVVGDSGTFLGAATKPSTSGTSPSTASPSRRAMTCDEIIQRKKQKALKKVYHKFSLLNVSAVAAASALRSCIFPCIAVCGRTGNRPFIWCFVEMSASLCKRAERARDCLHTETSTSDT